MSAACLICTAPAYAADAPKLETIYGEDLMKVPLLIRSKFQSDTGKSWDDTTLEERTEFLAKWQQKRMADQDSEKNRAKEIQNQKKTAADREHIRQLKKQAKAHALEEKQRAKDAEKRAKEEKKRNLIKKREDALNDLKKTQMSRNKH
jgi:hypothetical protein